VEAVPTEATFGRTMCESTPFTSPQAPSLSSSDQPIMQSLASCPVVSFSSTLDGDARVPSFGTQGRRNWNPSEITHTYPMRWRVREEKTAWVMRYARCAHTGAVDIGSFGGRPGTRWWHDLNRFSHMMYMRNIWEHNLPARADP
jgi:hypothetical protein